MLYPKLVASKLHQISRYLWVRVAVIAALSVFAALSAPVLDPLLPQMSKDRFDAEATLPVLNILASGMLAVATFSLGVMVSSHRTLASNTTPRIHRLLMEDTTTQSMLATFIGAFVFSLCSIILLRAGYYTEGATVVVFIATIVVVASIVVSLIRWIHKLSSIGSIDYALERAECTAKETLRDFRRHPTFGAIRLRGIDDIPSDTNDVLAPESGFLQRLDTAALQACGEANEANIYVLTLPGDRILAGQVIARIHGTADMARVADAFVLGSSRSHEQDPRYALQALRETASRALSPGINDPGTAVEVVIRLEILLHDFFCADPGTEEGAFERVFIDPLEPRDLIKTAFRDIARDGAGFVDVLETVSAAFQTMEELGDRAARETVAELRSELEEHAMKTLRTDAERDRLSRFLSGDDGARKAFSKQDKSA